VCRLSLGPTAPKAEQCIISMPTKASKGSSSPLEGAQQTARTPDMGGWSGTISFYKTYHCNPLVGSPCCVLAGPQASLPHILALHQLQRHKSKQGKRFAPRRCTPNS
jgi:hypothetical protein